MALTLSASTFQRGTAFQVAVLGAADRSRVVAFSSDGESLTTRPLFILGDDRHNLQVGWLLTGTYRATGTPAISLVEYPFNNTTGTTSAVAATVQAGAVSPTVALATFPYTGMGPFYAYVQDAPSATVAVNAFSSDGISVRAYPAFFAGTNRTTVGYVLMGVLRFGGSPTVNVLMRDRLGTTSSATGLTLGGGGGTPAPAFTTQPTMSPTSGTATSTLFTANDGVASNATGYTRRWLLNGTSIGTGTTVTPAIAGSLVLEVTATGPGGSTIATSAASTVSAAATGLSFVQPSSIIYDFDPASLSALSSGAAVSDWTDAKSGLALNQPTSGNQPTYQPNVLNGKPAVRFAGSQWFDMGRPAPLVAAMDAANYTIMIVATNLVAGANALAGFLGNNSAGIWLVTNVTQLGLQASTSALHPNTLTTTDLYVTILSVRPGSTGFSRTLGLVNTTGLFCDNAGPVSGTENFGLGTTRVSTTANANTYSARGDLLRFVVWNGWLGNVDCVRQTRRVFEYLGKPMPWAGLGAGVRYWLSDGDSITQGIGAAPRSTAWPHISAGVMGRKIGEYSNIGRTGASAVNLTAARPYDVDGIQGADALGIPVLTSFMEYANQRATTGVATTPIANSKAYLSGGKTANAGMKFAFGNSTGLGGTTAGDESSAGVTSTQGTGRLAYNAAFPSGSADFDVLLDFAAQANYGIIGSNPYSTTYQTEDFSDVTHPRGYTGQLTGHGYKGMGEYAATVLPAALAS